MLLLMILLELLLLGADAEAAARVAGIVVAVVGVPIADGQFALEKTSAGKQIDGIRNGAQVSVGDEGVRTLAIVFARDVDAFEGTSLEWDDMDM